MYISIYKIVLIYEDRSAYDLDTMLWRTLMIDYNGEEANDKDIMIGMLRKCDKEIENSAYAYGNIFDLARLCALKGFDTKGASRDILKQILITGKNNTIYVPLIGIRLYNPFNTNIHIIRPQYNRLLDYKYIDDDILIEYISKSKHNYNNYLKFCGGRNDYIEWLTNIDKVIIDSNYINANRYDIERLCHMRSIPISDNIDEMRDNLKSFSTNRDKS